MKRQLDLLAKAGFALITFLLFSNLALAQRTITGTVSDSESGESLIGATVTVVGTQRGTVTDIDGNYSIEVPNGATQIRYSYTGYGEQTLTIGASNSMNVSLATSSALDEVVVVGYGSQKEKEITSAVTSVSAEEFNKGPINDPAQLLQGKVAGLQVYNRGGDPNRSSTIRMRGISTVGANVEPLVVVDGIIGASLANVDPNDIETIDVLKDGSAAAIYGSRGSSGVIIITTKKGSKDQKIQLSYSGQLGASTKARTIKNMTASEFVAAGGTDLGSSTNWIDEVTQTGVSQIHNVSAAGGGGNTSYRVSANFRDVDGILQNSGFNQFNTRLNLSTKALNDKLSVDFNTSLTTRNSQFGFNEALRYATLYNPTAPILGQNSPYPFNSDQFGGYFEALGLFDAFNPVSIVNQNINEGKRNEFNYGATLGYNITDALKVNFRSANQVITNRNQEYYPTTSLFRGNASSPIRKGSATRYEDENRFKLYEAFATYLTDFGSSNMSIVGGYSYQQDNFNSSTLTLGDFPNNNINFGGSIEASQDLQNAGLIAANSDVSPDNKIIALFGRVNYTYDDAIFLNASVRREGSTKLGEDNKWGLFPAVGVGVDLNHYLGLGSLDLFKVRLGYGVTGALPRDYGLAQPIRQVVNAADGTATTELIRAANPDLKWEEKHETNLGIELASGRWGATIDLYNRDIQDFILERTVDAATFQVDRRFENAGKLNTKGFEVALNYDLVQSANTNYNTGIVLSSYKTKLVEYVVDATMIGNLGAPGQNGTNMIRVKEGEEIGQIWGPVYSGVGEDGSPVFVDVNNDGEFVTGQDKALEDNADFEVLGKGIPALELGWTNQLSIGDWNINAFFRGAFGHSLVNAFRAFYEPQVSTQSSYNFMNTSLAVPGLTSARFSSLYVEKADFFKLDNLTISRRIPVGEGKAISNLNVALTGNNLFVITKYTGADPEPSLVDYGAADNGGVVDYSNPNVLAPGIDRRNNYFSARTFTFGLNFNF